MPLLTAPFPQGPETWLPQMLKMAEDIRQHDEQLAQVKQVAALQDARKAIEFERSLEFNRAKTAADDKRADAELDLTREINTRKNAAIDLPILEEPPRTSGRETGGLAVAATGPIAEGLPEVVPAEARWPTPGPDGWIEPPAVAIPPAGGNESDFAANVATMTPAQRADVMKRQVPGTRIQQENDAAGALPELKPEVPREVEINRRVRDQFAALGIKPTREEAIAAGKEQAQELDLRERAVVKSTSVGGSKVKVNLQTEDGGLYTQFANGSWKDDKSPPPGSKVFTIGAPGRQQLDKAALIWHADGSVTSGNKVLHYNADGVLEPAFVPKGKTVKDKLIDRNGEIQMLYSDGTWSTPDGRPPVSAGLTRIPGATEEARLELRSETDKVKERDRTIAAYRSDRSHYDRVATTAGKEIDDLAKVELDWPWKNDEGVWKKRKDPKNSKSSALITIGEGEATQMIAKAEAHKARQRELATQLQESGKRSADIQAKIEAAERGEMVPEGGAGGPAPGKRPIFRDKDGNRAYKNPDGSFEPIT